MALFPEKYPLMKQDYVNFSTEKNFFRENML